MPYEVVRKFENTIARFAGSTYGVAVESCTAAILLSCAYLKVKKVMIPRFTYPGVACSIIHAGGRVGFHNRRWSATYMLEPYNICDSALRFRKNMYIPGSLYCLSFHAKKHLPIGRGGMILTNDINAWRWLRKARFDGRAECPLDCDNISTIGWNAYMTPEQAARGLLLFEMIKNRNIPDLSVADQGYIDLSKIGAYQK